MKVYISSDSGGYNGSFLIRSGKKDRIVRLKLNTFTLGRYGNEYQAGIPGTTLSAASTVSSDDKVLEGQLNQSTPILNSLSPGSYTLRVTVNGEQTDKNSLKIKDLSSTGIWTRITPREELDEYYRTSDVREAIADENDHESIASGDVLVLGIRKSGLSGVLTAEDNPSKQLLTHNGSAFSLTVRQQNPKNNQTAKILDLRETIRRDGLELFIDEENEMVYLLAQTDELVFRGGAAGNRDAVAINDKFNIKLTLLKRGSLVESSKTFETTFEVVERSVEFQHKGNMITVQSGFNQSIAGRTTVAPGTELEIQAKSNGTDSFLKQAPVEISSERTFNSAFDFIDVSQNTTFWLSVPGVPDTSAVGIVGESLRASVSFDKQQFKNRNVSISSVTLSHGGYLALKNGSASGTVIGISRTFPPGKYDSVTVPLNREWNGSKSLVAVPYYNRTNAKRTGVRQSDIAYRQDGSVISATALITKPTPQSDAGDTNDEGTGGPGIPNGTRMPAADESLPPIDAADDPLPPSDDVGPATRTADSARPRLADLSVAAYGVVAFGLLVVFVVVRE